jgi:hypothetical protein
MISTVFIYVRSVSSPLQILVLLKTLWVSKPNILILINLSVHPDASEQTFPHIQKSISGRMPGIHIMPCSTSDTISAITIDPINPSQSLVPFKFEFIL